MNALILIDKPRGPTSAQVTQWVSEILNEKAGHCGTLDPEVTGVLPILVGKGRKLIEYLQKHDKEYVCLMKIEEEIPEEKINTLFKEFTGKIYQKPPELSAVSKKIRIRRIYELELIQKKKNYYLFRVSCQHGTYIRKLVEDFGKVLGTKTTMLQLRRTRSGPFTEEECITITKLKDAVALEKENPKLLKEVIKPLEYAVKLMPKAIVKETAEKNILKGAPVFRSGIIELKGHIVKGSPIAIINEKQELIAIGTALYDKKTIINSKKGKMIKTEKVIK